MCRPRRLGSSPTSRRFPSCTSRAVGYNTAWDPCTTKYLTQAGVRYDWVHLQDIGIEGNGHFMFIEKNSDQVAGVVLDWIKRLERIDETAGETSSVDISVEGSGKSMRNTHRVTKQVRHPVLSAGMLAVMMAGSAAVTLGQESEGQAGPLVLKQGYFYVAGAYDNPAAPTSMSGRCTWSTRSGGAARGRVPIIMVHGGGTPARVPEHAGRTARLGRLFHRHGWPVYVVDQPGARSRHMWTRCTEPSAPPCRDSSRERVVGLGEGEPGRSVAAGDAAHPVPGDGSHTHGDTVFDQYYAHLAPGISNGLCRRS